MDENRRSPPAATTGDFGGDKGPVMKVGEEKELGNPGVKKKLVKEGEGGETPELGDECLVHFKYIIVNGAKIISSHDQGEPTKFKLGQGKIKCLDQCIKTMKRGEISVFTIPAELAFGASDSHPTIPPNATLQFDITLFSWTNSSAICINGGIFKKILKKGEKWENPKDPDEVLVKYEARLLDGTPVSKSEGVQFVVKDGYFCPALAIAVKTMKKAEKVHLTVKAQYGFGENGRPATEGKGAVPPNASICIDLELLSWRTVTDAGDDKKKFKRVLEAGEDFECVKDTAAQGSFIESKFRLAYAKAIRSIVEVEALDSNNRERYFCAGSVLLKTTRSIFVMTATFLANMQCDIHVRFSNNSVSAAKVMLKGSQFSVLIVQTLQSNICQPISFRDKLARYEDVMILATVPWEPHFCVIDGTVIQESCEGHNKRKEVVEESKQYFITSCPFHNTINLMNTLMSAPVFDLDGDSIGFIVADCSSTHSGRLLKRVMHAKNIANLIGSMSRVSVGNREEQYMCLITEGNWVDALISLDKEYGEKHRIVRKFRAKRSGE